MVASDGVRGRKRPGHAPVAEKGLDQPPYTPTHPRTRRDRRVLFLITNPHSRYTALPNVSWSATRSSLGQTILCMQHFELVPENILWGWSPHLGVGLKQQLTKLIPGSHPGTIWNSSSFEFWIRSFSIFRFSFTSCQTFFSSDPPSCADTAPHAVRQRGTGRPFPWPLPWWEDFVNSLTNYSGEIWSSH